jgi:branched-chain amino acid transport system ATP-binding protein
MWFEPISVAAEGIIMLLAVSDLHLRYGRITALRGVAFEVGTGEVVAIVGPNGAGKTSTLKAIAGAQPVFQGDIVFDGRSIRGLAPESRAKLGLSLVPEGRDIFTSLSVEENLIVGTAARISRREIGADLERLLGYFPVLRQRFHHLAKGLSGGEQQQLAICRALMVRPKLLLLDEPSLGLAPQMIDIVYDILIDLKKREGVTILLVEQSLDRALEIADRVCAMGSGVIERTVSGAVLRAELDGEAAASPRRAAWG